MLHADVPATMDDDIAVYRFFLRQPGCHYFTKRRRAPN